MDKKIITILRWNCLRISFSKFRCINHKLTIEKGRFIGIAIDDKICNLCNSAELGDEYHFIFECNVLKAEQQKGKPFIPVEFYLKIKIK